MSENESQAIVKYGAYDAEAAQYEAEQIEMEKGEIWSKLPVGKTRIRVLPPPRDAAWARLKLPSGKIVSTPFKVIYQHFYHPPESPNITRVFACPRMMVKQPCLLCDMANELRANGNPADRDAGQSLMAQRAVFANVIDRKHPEVGPRVITLKKGVHQQITDIGRDPDVGGDFTDPVNGFDLVIVRTGTGKNDTEYKVLAVKNTSPLAPDTDTMNTWLAMQFDLNKYAVLMSRDSMQDAIDKAGKEEGSRSGGGGRPQRRSRTAADDLDGDTVDGVATDLDE